MTGIDIVGFREGVRVRIEGAAGGGTVGRGVGARVVATIVVGLRVAVVGARVEVTTTPLAVGN